MPPRRLSPDERAAWRRLARSVRPLRAGAAPHGEEPPLPRSDDAVPSKEQISLTTIAPAKASPALRPVPAEVLDGSWERRIQRGQLQPEMSIDLHGHSLSLAHQRLERALADAVARDMRVVLVITGKARDRGASGGRGAIRAEIGYWLESSALADRIASVRAAHPRHGGAGALYVILRRKKS